MIHWGAEQEGYSLHSVFEQTRSWEFGIAQGLSSPLTPSGALLQYVDSRLVRNDVRGGYKRIYDTYRASEFGNAAFESTALSGLRAVVTENKHELT